MDYCATVVVCTFNRDECLPDCFRSLFEQVTDFRYEVLVVDNNSTDHTQAVIEGLCVIYPDLRCVVEPRQGLSHARNLALKEARGKIVAFIDDDGIAQPGWLASIVTALRDESVAVVGGKIDLHYPSQKPDWLASDLEPYLSKWDRGTEAMDTDFAVGCNFAVRKEIALEVGGFNTSLGYNGKVMLPGEEFDFCVRVRQLGYRVRYDPGSVVMHRVHPDRLDKGWFIRRAFLGGKAEAFFSQTDSVSMQDCFDRAVYHGLVACGDSISRDVSKAFLNRCVAAHHRGRYEGMCEGGYSKSILHALHSLRPAVLPGCRTILRSFVNGLCRR